MAATHPRPPWAGKPLRAASASASRFQAFAYGGERRRGRPATRWEDSLEAYAREYATKWEVLAQDRNVWAAWEAGFVQRAMIKQKGREPDVDSGDDGVTL